MKEMVRDEYSKKVKGRVLFTGGLERMADDLMEHISEDYRRMKCPGTESAFTDAMEKFKPHVVVICLLDGLSEVIGTYYILEDVPEYTNIPVIIIGHEEDCDRFRRKLGIRKLKTFLRPLDSNLFHEALDKCAREMDGLVEDPESEKQTLLDSDNLFWEEKLKEVQGGENDLAKKVEHVSMFKGRKSILVVDDDVQMLNVIKLYLQDLYDITVVPNGKLALKFLEKKTADLVLLDYMMPEMDGPEVLQEIRKSEKNQELPVIFLTGVSEKDRIMNILGLRPNGYLLKPVTRDVLLERVTAILLGI